jgi:hypothetical protein
MTCIHLMQLSERWFQFQNIADMSHSNRLKKLMGIPAWSISQMWQKL